MVTKKAFVSFLLMSQAHALCRCNMQLKVKYLCCMNCHRIWQSYENARPSRNSVILDLFFKLAYVADVSSSSSVLLDCFPEAQMSFNSYKG